jgi:50S ribosomal protein L16 3-hydroxylase
VALCDNDALSQALLESGLQNPEFVHQLTEWVNAGYWYFQD